MLTEVDYINKNLKLKSLIINFNNNFNYINQTG